MSKYYMIEIAFNNKEEINETRMIENGSDKSWICIKKEKWEKIKKWTQIQKVYRQQISTGKERLI